MGFRFQRRVKIAPGIRLNFSLRGISTTIGPRGASVNLGHSGAHLNLGIPGTGLSYRERLDRGPSRPARSVPGRQQEPDAPPGLLSREDIASEGDVSSATLADLAAAIRESRNSRRRLTLERKRARDRELWTSFKTGCVLVCSLGGLLAKGVLTRLRAERQQHVNYQQELLRQIEAERLVLEAELSDVARRLLEEVRVAFVEAARSHVVWDITSQAFYDRRVTRSYASTSVGRVPTRLLETAHEDIPVASGLLCFRNQNGGDLYLSPAFLATDRKGAEPSLTDLKDVSIEYSMIEFVETGPVPQDAMVIGSVWEKSNKDGSPDRRFAQNREIPLVGYGRLRISSTTGLNECFLFSSDKAASRLASALMAYLTMARGAS